MEAMIMIVRVAVAVVMNMEDRRGVFVMDVVVTMRMPRTMGVRMKVKRVLAP